MAMPTLAAPPAESNLKRKEIEKLVRQEFDLQMEKQRKRIEKAEAQLQEISLEFDRRMSAADDIVSRRVNELLSVSENEADDTEDSASLLSAEGWQAWRKQDWRTAMTKFQRAIKLEPENASALNGLGWTKVHLSDYKESISLFERVLKLEPQHGGAMNGIGQSLMALGRYSEAETKLLEATNSAIKQHGEAGTVNQQITASWFGLVQLYLSQGKSDEAVKWAERFLKHDSDNQMMKNLLDRASSKETN